MKSNFSKNLIELRKESGLTQHQVAEKLNVDDSCYAKWEQGRRQPNIDNIIKLCEIFDVEADVLLGIKK